MPNPGSLLYPNNNTATLAAKPVGYPSLSNPIPRVNIAYVLRQTFQQWGNSWTPLALGTAYNTAANFDGATNWTDFSAFLLVEESERTDIGGGFVQWTRTFAKIPDDHEEPTTVTYQFPGWIGTDDETNREPFSKTVVGKIVYHYEALALVGNILALPTIYAQEYLNIYDAATITLYSEDSINASNPTVEEYQTMIDNAQEIVAQDSEWEIWMGLICRRKTIYILPQ